MNHAPSKNFFSQKTAFSKPGNIEELHTSLYLFLRQLGFDVKTEVCEQSFRTEKSNVIQSNSQTKLVGRDSIIVSFEDFESNKLVCIRKSQGMDAQKQNSSMEALQKVDVGDIALDHSQRVCTVAGKEIDLTTGDFDLLWLLATQAGQVVNRKDLYRKLMDYDPDPRDRAIDLRISRLRKKLDTASNSSVRIKSIRGVGYLLAKAPC